MISPNEVCARWQCHLIVFQMYLVPSGRYCEFCDTVANDLNVILSHEDMHTALGHIKSCKFRGESEELPFSNCRSICYTI